MRGVNDVRDLEPRRTPILMNVAGTDAATSACITVTLKNERAKLLVNCSRDDGNSVQIFKHILTRLEIRPIKVRSYLVALLLAQFAHTPRPRIGITANGLPQCLIVENFAYMLYEVRFRLRERSFAQMDLLGRLLPRHASNSE